MINKTISHYKILEKLGEGGMGVVYKAEDTKLKRTVALKFLPPELTREAEAKARFIHEAQSASALDHNNICNIHDIDETKDGQLFIVMAYYEGETIKQRIEHGPLKIDEAIDIAIQVARGLESAHESGIVHRDIKPANLMITEKGEIKILDFGLAKLSSQTLLTKEGTTLGTVAYMSPEQTRGEEVGQRTDIWSLGVILFEMITGQSPFKGEYDQAVMYSIVNEEPESVTAVRSGVPMELEYIVNKSLEKNQDERYQHVDDLIVDLHKLKREPKSKTSYTTAGLQTKKRKRNKLMLILSGLVFISAILGMVGYLLFAPQEKEKISKRKKLVVLPFENLGPTEDAYFADGITEEITSRLAAISSLGIISRKSALQYAKTEKTVRQIGEELGIDYLLEGTVRWARTPDGFDRVRITPQLIRVSDDTHLWAKTYDRVIDDIFEIQSEIALIVIEQLGVTLLESERKSVETQSTKNLDAYNAYLRGRYYAGRPHFSLENWTQVIKNYQQAIELDPYFGLAYAELSKAHARLYYLRSDLSESRLAMAKQAAQRALELAPKSPAVHLALSYYYLWAYRDSEKALKDLAIAEKGLPNNVEIMKAKASLFQPQGRWGEFLDTVERAFELSPRDVSLATDLAVVYWITRNYEKAISACNQAISLSPNATWPYLYKTFSYWGWKGANKKSRAVLMTVSAEHEWYPWAWYWQEVGEKNFQAALELLSSTKSDWIRNKCWARPKSLFSAFIYDFLNEQELAFANYDSARIVLEKEVQAKPDDPRYHSSLGIAYAGLGRKDDAIREGKRAVELLPLSKDAVYGIPHAQDLAFIYTLVVDYDAALDQLEKLLSIPSWISIPWIQMDLRLAPLYNYPRYQKLVEKYSGDYE